MPDPFVTIPKANLFSARTIFFWRLAQSGVWLVGAGILLSLFLFPKIGLLLFWHILIPVAPALFVFAAGVWRNVCPLATTNLLPCHWGLSQRKKLTATQSGKLNLLSVLLLYTIVPLRHAVFNTDGVATGLLIVTLSTVGITLGFFYEWKSAWCSGLCPVHPVEKLYGSNVAFTVPNAHCDKCMNCVVPCPDSTPNIHPSASVKTIYHKLSGWLIVGGLPGFIWGWFHVPDHAYTAGINAFPGVYQMPLMGMLLTLSIYAIFAELVVPGSEKKLSSLFAAAGVSCYYWYRLPALFGMGDFKEDGFLVDLSASLPFWVIRAFTIALALLFFYWLVIRSSNKQSWAIRPPYGDKYQK
ncbi:MAG TPA: hypothetical protein VGE25_03110 [Sediminibacterium sp.]